MSARTFIIGVCLFAAGLLLGRIARFPSTTTDIVPKPVEGKVEGHAAPGFTSIAEAIRLAPEVVLEDLANHPYLTLTDAEMKALAAAVDIRNEKHRRLVDLVTPPKFGQELWHAVMRANLGKMPLEELIGLTKDARYHDSDFGLPIAEAIHDSPDRDQILASEWGGRYRTLCLERLAGKFADLKDALALVPAGEPNESIYEELVANWMHARPTAASVGRVFELTSSDRLLKTSMRQNAAAIAWQVPGERQEILTKVTALPGQQRNWMLNTLANQTPPDDPAALVSVLSQFTSFSYQEHAARKWLGKQDDEGKQKLIRALDAMKDNPSVRKLRAKLAE